MYKEQLRKDRDSKVKKIIKSRKISVHASKLQIKQKQKEE
jgi:hypothetical protein